MPTNLIVEVATNDGLELSPQGHVQQFCLMAINTSLSTHK